VQPRPVILFLIRRAITLGANLNQHRDASRRLSRSLSDRWQELCARYLPFAQEGSIWRFSRAVTARDPEQGWKLHVSATVLTANRVLEEVAPFLQSRSTLFKCPSSLRELNKLNCGLYYGYTQVGKCLTIYPDTAGETVRLAEKLHELTSGLTAPSVPFDLRLRPGSCVYYRYGAFKHLEIENEDGTRTLAVRDPEGRLVPDERESWRAMPDWVSDPFLSLRPQEKDDPATESPLKTTFRVFRALTQRGKGGVYQAIDMSAQPIRLCILKEGRRNGELGWDGRDGYCRVKNEETALKSLRACGVDVPRVYASFEVEGNFYLATEFIEGASLQSLLSKRERRLPVKRVLQYSRQLISLVARIHSAGWVWRDCKPGNLVMTKEGHLRPLDFEGACPINQPDPVPWGTPAFVPHEFEGELRGQSKPPADLYALGVIIYYMLSGSVPSAQGHIPVEKLRRNVPPAARSVVSELLSPDPRRRPLPQAVMRRLKAALLEIDSPR
jgi:hypothetical protein